MEQTMSPWKCAQFRTVEGREGFVAHLEGLTRDGIGGIEFERIESASVPGCWYRAPGKLMDSIGYGVQAHDGNLVPIDRDAL
jgi:hypothetical protein